MTRVFCIFGCVETLYRNFVACRPEGWIWSGGVCDLVGRLGIKKLCIFAIRSEWVLTGEDCFAIYWVLRSQFKNYLNFMDVDIGIKWYL